MSPRLVVLALLFVTAACGSNGTSATLADGTMGTSAAPTTAAATGPGSATAPSTTAADAPAPTEFDVADAVSINVTANGDQVALAWATADAVWTAAIGADGTPGEPVAVNGAFAPFSHPIERPAVAIDDEGRTHVAFTTLAGDGGSVAYSVLDGESVHGPVVVSGPPRIETVLVHMTESPSRQPAMAWLEDSSLTVATPTGREDDTPVEQDGVDDQTCDCCNPVPILVGDDLVVAYRDLVRTGTEVIRDVVAVWSDDGGESYSPVVPIADESWFIDACPFSGPDIIDVDGTLVTTWMDARQSLHPDQDATTIWVDRSEDGGRTFGEDVAITDGGIHRWPMLDVDADGDVHLIWETQDRDAGGISYSRSTDGAATFTAPSLLIPNDDSSGSRRSPSLTVSSDRLLVTWIDRSGGHLASFELAALG